MLRSAQPDDPQPLPVQGTCGGYEIRSGLRFQTLRRGGGTPLEIREAEGLDPDGELLLSWSARPDNPFEGRLLVVGKTFAFWASDSGWYLVDPGIPAITMTAGVPSLARELRLFGVPASICALERGDLSIHASAVDVAGGAILLAGPSHAGKTTLAAAFAAAGHRLLTEDSTRITLRPRPLVYPGPAAVRLRADVGRYVTPRLSHRAPAADGRVPLIIDDQARGDGLGLPLRAIVFLRAGGAAPSLSVADAATSIRDLFALSFRLPTTSSRAATFERVAELVATVGTHNLVRPVTIGSLPAAIRLLEDHVATA